ncbi:zona pellucida sperm-binding protein 4-like isoform X2 [Scophthalmus maximus]|uniref:zona pellucida sperm-binding protein 4-like isoform X2 n=1 Tax=Scophthalmus maximus TaxID=52904 RepID=UPI001FA8285C|nr:zona pellucida sperm-binding protein 4-like isoform X2 [Scophthalmus maximus]
MSRAKLCWVSLALALAAQHCWCLSAAPMKKTPDRRRQLALPRVTCAVRSIKAVFGPTVKRNIHVRDMSGAMVPVPEDSCGVRVGREKNQNLLFYSRYDSCYVQIEGYKVVIPLQVQLTGEDQWFSVNISCPLIKRSREETPSNPTLLPGECGTDRALRVGCGHRTISSDACDKLGCCYDGHDFTCYYRLNACSVDGHFVFSVKATDTDPPITPSSLIVKDQPQCFPEVTTPDTAVFKIGVTDCGAKKKVDGDVVIYEVEVEELYSENRARHSPFSLQVQCEYAAADLKRAADLRSLYAVTNPPPVVALGTIRVQMRIATDASFTSFFPEEQLPLTLPLREAAYVEVSIAQPSPDPTLSLRVQDCFAYPGSRHSVWMLLYDGCPNPLDNMRSSVPVDKQGKTTSHSQVRRFDVKTFAFLDPHTGHPSGEEMYFYCWVEICTDDDDCAQSCALISSEGERRRRRRRRGTTSESDQLHLVSSGPLLLGQNNTEVEENPCVRQNTMFQVTVYILSGVGAALLLVLLFTLWSSLAKCQKTETQQACDARVDIEQCQ